MEIRDHHRRAIDRLTDAYRDDPRFLALIIGGSVAKGWARADSDVDFMIIATDAEYAQRLATRDLFINRRDLCDYEGGYVDGKVLDLAYLRDVASHGNEPSRAAFTGAFASYSRIDGLDETLRSIAVYPAAGHDDRIRRFYSMAFIQHWLMHEAVRHDNRYTIMRAANQLALFAGRLILAHNRVLYPYHKWLMQALQSAAEKPAGLLADIDALLTDPGSETASRLFDSLKAFRDWGVSDLDAYTWFMTDVEWSWRSDSTPLEDI